MTEQAPTWWEGAISLVSESLRRSLPANQQYRLAQLSAEELPLEQRKRLAGRLVEELLPELQEEIATRVALELPPEHLENLIEVVLSVADPETVKRTKKRLDSGDRKAALIAVIPVAITIVLEAWMELFVQAPLEGVADKTSESLRQVTQRTWEALKEAASKTLGGRRPPLKPEMVHIPAGEFWMGTNCEDLERAGIKWKDYFKSETPRNRVDLPEYLIGKYPVTNAQFTVFVASGGYDIRKYWTEAGWAWQQDRKRKKPAYRNDPTWNLSDHPVVGVLWYEAVAYCNWLADKTDLPYRLPSEAEWEKAGRGTDKQLYPWGDELPDKRRCNFDRNMGRTTPVGQYSPWGDSPYGVADMAGNVWEWCSSKLGYDYPYTRDDGREELDGSDLRVLRGGSQFSPAEDCRCGARFGFVPWGRLYNGGFRCVRTSPR